MTAGGRLHPQCASQNKSQIEAGKPTKHGNHQVRKRIKDFIFLQHRVQFHDESRQRRETAAKAYREQQSVLIRHNSRIVKPGRGCNKLRDNTHCETTQQVRTQGAPWNRNIPLQKDVQAEPRHRAERAADGHKEIR